MGYLQLKFIKSSCRAMSDTKLLELYALVMNQEDKTEKEYPQVVKLITDELIKRGLPP
jgi:hypothetical protein